MSTKKTPKARAARKDPGEPIPIVLSVEVNAEGDKLAYLMRNDGGYRIAGPKAWGGSTPLASFTFGDASLIEFIVGSVPEMVPRLVRALRERRARMKE